MPQEFNGYTCSIVFVNSNGSFVCELNDGKIVVPQEVSLIKDVKLQLVIKDNSGTMIFKSKIKDFVLNDSIDDSGNNIFDELKDRLKDEYYTQGYEEGYEQGRILERQIVAFAESATTQTQANTFTTLGSEGNLVGLPYMNTEKVAWDTTLSVIGNYIESIGLDFSGISYYKGIPFYNKPNLKKVILTGYVNLGRKIEYGYAQTFANCVNLQEVYADFIKAGNMGRNTSSNKFDKAFSGCKSLKIIGGFNKETRQVDNENFGKIDFTNCISVADMFTGCVNLTEVRFKPLSLNLSLSVAQSNHLSQESVMSLINALEWNEDNHLGKRILTVHGDVEGDISNCWYCKYDGDMEGTFHIADPEVEIGTIPFSSVIAEKGWALQY